MSLDNSRCAGSGQSDTAHSDDGDQGLHDDPQLDKPVDERGDGRGSEDSEAYEVELREQTIIQQKMTRLYLLIQDNDTDEGACESIANIEGWRTMVNTPTSDGSKETPLHIATRKGFAKIAEHLLVAGADVNAEDGTKTQPLQKACDEGNNEMVKVLCGHGPMMTQRNEDGWYPIHVAIAEGLEADTVRLLLGPDKECINAKESLFGLTPLNLAVYYGKENIVSTLLEHGADPAIKATDGWTPLMTAVEQREFEIFDRLLLYLESHCQEDFIDVQNKLGKTVLMSLITAIGENNESSQAWASFTRLLELGPRVGVADKGGRTVLHHAISCAVHTKDPSVALDILHLAKDGTLLLKDKQGNTAFDIALDASPNAETANQVLDKIIDRLKEGYLRIELLCWLVQRKEMHDKAKQLLSEVEGSRSPNEALKSNEWGLVEWVVFHRLPQVLMSYVTATRQISPSSDQRESEGTRENCQKLIDSLENDDFEKKKLSKSTPLPTRDRGKKIHSRGGEGEGGGKEEGQSLRDMRDILDFYLVSKTATSLETLDLSKPSDEMKPSLKELHAAVIQMRQDDREFTTFVKSRNVDEIVYKNERLETVGDTIERFQKLLPRSNGSAEPTSQSVYGFGGEFTWVHFPSTNMVWMTDIMKKIMKQFDCDRDELQNLVSFLRTSWVQIPDRTSATRFMRPLYVERKARKAAETDLNNRTNNGTQTGGSKGERALPTSATASSEDKKQKYVDSSALYMPFLSFSTYYREQQNDIHQKLFEAYRDEPIHCSPTLDEFYYQFATGPEYLEDQSSRNEGQIVTKFLHEEGVNDSWSLLRVSQLWIWILGDNSNANNKFVLDILAHLRRRTEYGIRRGPRSPAELSEVIVEYCIGNFEKKYGFDSQGHKQDQESQQEGSGSRTEQEREPSKPTNGRTQDARQSGAGGDERSIHQIFSDSINKIGRDEAALFSKFLRRPKKGIGKGDGENQSKLGVLQEDLKGLSNFPSKNKISTAGKSTWGRGDSQDGLTEPLTTETLQDATQQAAKLLFEIKDVRDELNIIKTVAQFQRKVQSAMKRHDNYDTCTAQQNPKGAVEDLTADYVCNDIIELDKVAEQIQESVRTTISLQESEIANLQAIEAVNEAKRMTVFTITSIVFLPLSFLSSLFALDVSSFLEAPAWSLVVIFTLPLPFLVWAAAYVYGPKTSKGQGKRDNFARGGKEKPSKIRELLSEKLPTMHELRHGSPRERRNRRAQVREQDVEGCGEDPCFEDV